MTQNIWYYSEPSFECNFLVGTDNKPETAIQVCYELNEENRERELKGLAETCKRFNLSNALVVTFDQTDIASYDRMMAKIIDSKSFFVSSLEVFLNS